MSVSNLVLIRMELNEISDYFSAKIAKFFIADFHIDFDCNVLNYNCISSDVVVLGLFCLVSFNGHPRDDTMQSDQYLIP